jgi:hypothetical protein
MFAVAETLMCFNPPVAFLSKHDCFRLSKRIASTRLDLPIKTVIIILKLHSICARFLARRLQEPMGLQQHISLLEPYSVCGRFLAWCEFGPITYGGLNSAGQAMSSRVLWHGGESWRGASCGPRSNTVDADRLLAWCRFVRMGVDVML